MRFPDNSPVRFQAWKQIILAVLLISAVTFLYDGYRRTRRSALERCHEQNAIYAGQIIDQVRFRFDLIGNVLKLWSASPEIAGMSDGLQESMQRLLEAHGSYISGISRMNAQGILRYTVPPYRGTEGTDISSQEHVQRLLETRSAVISDAFMTVQGYWAIAYHVPCFDESGDFNGSLAFLVPFREMFHSLFLQLLPGEETVPVVLSDDGLVLFSPIEEHEGLHFSQAFGGNPGLLDVGESAVAGETGYLVADIDTAFGDGRHRGRMLFSLTPFDFQGKEWYLILSVPQEVVMRNISGLSNRWLLGMAAIVLLALLYSTMKIRVWITSREEKKWKDVARLKDILIRTVDQAREAILILDEKERIVYSNRAADEVTGYGSGFVGRKISRVPLLELEPSLDGIRKKVARDGSWSGRLTGVALEDRPFKMDLTASAVTDDDGAVTSFIVIGRDVTAQVEMERRLLEQQKMEAIGQLAGGIAHDFNNLMVGVLGYAELLREHHASDSDVSRTADVIISAVHQASELTSQLLGYAGKGKHKMGVVDVGLSVRKVHKLLKRTLDRRVSVNLDLEEDVFVKGDPTQIEQVILNLAVNARDAMPEGGRLTFTLRRGTLPSDMEGYSTGSGPLEAAVLKTEDTGLGIPRKNMERIFEPFFTTKAEEGTGMGLATVYGIVVNHGGRVDVESVPGKGSVFTVYLPLDRSGRESMAEEVPAPPAGRRGGGRTILVVDDEFVVVDTVTELLEELGYKVVSAPGGDKALELYSAAPKTIDAVILDLSMPGMDGKECFARLREIDREVKVVLITGFSGDGRVQELLDMGVREFLQKPFRLRELADALESLLRT
ncbi:MAG: response regulator [Candidatus Aegiribacteria sp.]